MVDIFKPCVVHDGCVIPEEEKELRSILKLPLAKKIVYMRHTPYGYSPIDVKEICVADVYYPCSYLKKNVPVQDVPENEKTYSLFVTLTSGETLRILGPFFSQMQKRSFTEDMERENHE